MSKARSPGRSARNRPEGPVVVLTAPAKQCHMEVRVQGGLIF